MFAKTAALCAAAVTFITAAGEAVAAPVTYKIIGSVDSIFDTYGSVPLTSKITVGSLLTLTYTYDPSASVYSNTLQGSVPTTYIYTSPSNYSLSLPGFSLSGNDPNTTIAVANNSHYVADPNLFDSVTYALGEVQLPQGALPFVFPSGSSIYEATLNFTFEDDSASALNSFQAPANLSGIGFSNRSIDVDFNSEQGGVIVRADGLNVSEVSAAPEPSIWALMIVGVTMIGGMLRFVRRMSPAVARHRNR